MATHDVTSFSTGLRVTLGQAAHDLKTQVTQEAVSALLEAAKQHAGYQDHADRFEFRLRTLNGQTVLELKEKNWASKLKNAFGYTRRSQERQAAQEAIHQAFGLPQPGGQPNQRITGQMARAFVPEALKKQEIRADLIARAFVPEALKKQEIRADLIHCWQTTEKSFDKVIDRGNGQPSLTVPLPKTFVSDIIDRGIARVQDGKLLCSVGSNVDLDSVGKNARLDATETFLDLVLSGLQGTHDMARDNIKRNLLSFVMQGNAVFHLKQISAQLSAQNIGIVNPGDQTFDFELSVNDDQVVIDQRWESRDGLGVRTDIRNAVPNLTLPEYKSQTVFSLPIAELIRDDFNPASIQVHSAQWGFTGPESAHHTA